LPAVLGFMIELKFRRQILREGQARKSKRLYCVISARALRAACC
jgi:hypothetical protein